jgi:hypothetical protein
MSQDPDRDDERLSQLMRAVRADADPALWTRVRARIEAGESERRVRPRWLNWLARPAALATASLLLVITAGVGFATLPRGDASTSTNTHSYESLTDALIGDVDAGATPADADTGDNG